MTVTFCRTSRETEQNWRGMDESKMVRNMSTFELELLQNGSMDPATAVWEDVTNAVKLVQSKNRNTCKSRLDTNDSLCM